ncbi:carboxymuconolactone decarboxylase family protein [Puia sp.]|jgi:AhpD family alkylhydroperoxidase|uniref:carboxymuconolactone decarboxylase family protein n=1 Tax=Puia sp. TaxID=2045100 RepID=UPI002F3FF1C8
MSTRIKLGKADPNAYKAIIAFDKYLETSRLSVTHKDLIKIRASQMNGCSYCIDKHTKEARAIGETEQRIYALSAWRETPFFTPEERAILALTEEVTLISNQVSDKTYNEAAALFDEEYLGQLLLAAIIINAWNRIGIATGMSPAING